MAEVITIYLLFAGGVIVVAIIAGMLGYEFNGEYYHNSDRKKGWDPSENHNFGHTIHWHDHHQDHGSTF